MTLHKHRWCDWAPLDEVPIYMHTDGSWTYIALTLYRMCMKCGASEIADAEDLD